MVAFRKDGNPFNTTPILPPQAAPPARAPSPEEPRWRQMNGPTSPRTPISGGERKFSTTKMITWIAVAGTLIVVAILLCLLLRSCRAKQRDGNAKKHYVEAHKDSSVMPKYDESALQQTNQMDPGNFNAIYSFYSTMVTGKICFSVHTDSLQKFLLELL